MKAKCKKCEELKRFRCELKGEVKENAVDIRRYIKLAEYDKASHLASVNGALEYVIDKIDGILTLK